MIKIEHPDLKKIARDYYNEIKEIITDRCDYILEVFEVLFKGKDKATLEQHSIHGTSKKTLTNLFLTKNKLENQNQYSNVDLANCYPWVSAQRDSLFKVISYLNNDSQLQNLILCSPDDAKALENKIKLSLGLSTPLNKNVEILINNIIDYSIFNRFAYDIAYKLKINTCPYCNRIHVNTVIDDNDKGIIHPTFDHFFPQKHHPFLALSFYNLIPSCYYCNSNLKSSKKTDTSTHLHPYKEGFNEDVTFDILISTLKPNRSDPKNYTLFFKDNTDPLTGKDKYTKIFGGTSKAPNIEEGNLNLFRLREIYQSHLDIVGELVVKCDRLSLGYSDSLKGFFNLLKTNKTEFYQYYFGNYYNETDFHRRPMSKLTKDIVQRLIPNIIK